MIRRIPRELYCLAGKMHLRLERDTFPHRGFLRIKAVTASVAVLSTLPYAGEAYKSGLLPHYADHNVIRRILLSKEAVM